MSRSRLLLWVMFAASTLIFLFGAAWILYTAGQSEFSTFPTAGPKATNGGSDNSNWTPMIATFASLVTSLSTMVGLLIGWKKQNIETAKAEIEIARMRLDLEKAQFEANKDRASN